MVDIIEILYRQYKQLRDESEKLWQEYYDLQLTSAEWTVINNIHHGNSTVPQLMKHLDITKQAVHKFITALEEKGLVQASIIKAPKVQKKVDLTPLGYEIFEKSLVIQRQIEQQIEQSIGKEHYAQLKKLLQLPWIGQ